MELKRSPRQLERHDMANEKVLILEAPWSDDIDDTQATRDIYTSAETLLRIGPDPARIIYRPLISTTYVQDVEKFVDLDCNQSGPNVIILSAHGRVVKRRSRGRRRPAIRRELSAFDGEINLSRDVRALRGKLRHSIVILDSCWVGDTPERFRQLSRALAVGRLQRRGRLG